MSTCHTSGRTWVQIPAPIKTRQGDMCLLLSVGRLKASLRLAGQCYCCWISERPYQKCGKWPRKASSVGFWPLQAWINGCMCLQHSYKHSPTWTHAYTQNSSSCKTSSKRSDMQILWCCVSLWCHHKGD